MTVAEFVSLSWHDDRRPLIEPRGLSPIVADPTFLFPEETPDRAWRLFAHTAFGIRAWTSGDGVTWRGLGMVAANAMRAFVRRFPDGYRLYAEAYRPLALPLQLLPRRPRWRSRIEVRFSRDLAAWGPPRVLLEPTLSWQRDALLGDAVGNPCLVRDGEAWLLYFSASLVHVPDCGFDEPRFIGRARAAFPEGPFVVDPDPVIDPAEDARQDSLGAGSAKVIRLDDGFVALQNRITRDAAGRSRSALYLLASPDGVRWHPAAAKPLLAPDGGWRRSHVYACDVRRRGADGRWYLYYNARDEWHKTRGRERIGRLVAAG